MSQPLPLDGFAWLSEDEFDELDIVNVSNDSEDGGLHIRSGSRIPI